MHINQTNTKNKIGTTLAIATVLLACLLSVGVASAASDDSYLENMPRPSGAPDFNGGNFTFPDGMNPFNGTGSPGGQGGFPGDGTFPNGMNGNFTRPDASGGPGDMQPFNSQEESTTQTDYTLLIAGIAIAAVIIVLVVIVMLKKRKKNPEVPSVDQSAPSPPPTTEASASPYQFFN